MSPSVRLTTLWSMTMTVSPPDFAAMVERYQDAVCAIAYSVLRDQALSEEVAQDAFLIAWQKLPGMRPPPALPGWIDGTARNLARNAARRHKATPMLSEPAVECSPLDFLLHRESQQRVNRALGQLSNREREAVVLYYRTDESMERVASALAISEAAAKKRVQRGRERCDRFWRRSSLRFMPRGPARPFVRRAWLPLRSVPQRVRPQRHRRRAQPLARFLADSSPPRSLAWLSLAVSPSLISLRRANSETRRRPFHGATRHRSAHPPRTPASSRRLRSCPLMDANHQISGLPVDCVSLIRPAQAPRRPCR